jgi:hypothetical protein
MAGGGVFSARLKQLLTRSLFRVFFTAHGLSGLFDRLFPAEIFNDSTRIFGRRFHKRDVHQHSGHSSNMAVNKNKIELTDHLTKNGFKNS